MTTLEDLQGRATCSVDEFASLVRVSRDTAYESVKRGEIPSLRLGRRIVIPVPRLLELLGAEP